jgi:hypothetical protein
MGEGGGGRRNYDLNFFSKKITMSVLEKIQGGTLEKDSAFDFVS